MKIMLIYQLRLVSLIEDRFLHLLLIETVDLAASRSSLVEKLLPS
jgi:hypothetical protein